MLTILNKNRKVKQLDNHSMKIEKTEIWITCESALQLSDGRAIRGFFGNMYGTRQEFHGHRGDTLIYKHPMIQYKVFGGSALIVGLKEGAYLLKAVPRLEYLEIHHQKYSILKQNISVDTIPFGLTENMISYSFVTPWIGLNEENYDRYLTLKKRCEDITLFIERILVGNILSMSKSVGYEVKDRILIKANIEGCGTVDVKDGIELMIFQGIFETNFLIPELWGIGKFSSRGYGTIRCIGGGIT